MRSISFCQSAAASAQNPFNSLIDEFVTNLRCDGFSQKHIECNARLASHLLVWLEREGLALETLNAAEISCFVEHDCSGCTTQPNASQVYRCKPRRRPSVMRFVQFLENKGCVTTPGELDDNLRFVEEFVNKLRKDGYAAHTVSMYRNGGIHFIVWLHLSRISLCAVSPDICAHFHERQITLWYPGVLRVGRLHNTGLSYTNEVHRFVEYLSETGRISQSLPRALRPRYSKRIEQFSMWLKHNRNVCENTVARRTGQIAVALRSLGDDPREYDAAQIRQVLFKYVEKRSRSDAQQLATTLRMYLRFLVSAGEVSRALVNAVPSVPNWRLSKLPRYISVDDIERTIASCCGPMELRDRAILLLLARLGLRAGEIASLRLDDINWSKGTICITGKGGKQVVLPLPQDAGDALYVYIANVRSKKKNAAQRRVFLGAKAPHRPFAGHGAVSRIVRRALDRTGVDTRGTRGAHLFRHSLATHLLRNGTSLDVIQSLLRHESANTTMIYAKTDTTMLREVAQPWLGGIQQ